MGLLDHFLKNYSIFLFLSKHWLSKGNPWLFSKGQRAIYHDYIRWWCGPV